VASHNGIVRGIRGLVPESLKSHVRDLLGKDHPNGLSANTRRQLRAMPRFCDATIELHRKSLRICDAASFLSSHAEIFVRQIYKFPCRSAAPRIIDAGANIGLASIWLARMYPQARITAIECDDAIAGILRDNLRTFGVQADVIEGAVWDSVETLHFASDHADGGRIDQTGTRAVTGVPLAPLLAAGPVDFLKVDIEGAELRALRACVHELAGVANLFVEYHSQSANPQELSELLAILERSGFRYYIDRIGVRSAHPLFERHVEAGYDLQLNVFASRPVVE
jgi:FkbM family methyltransferase